MVKEEGFTILESLILVGILSSVIGIGAANYFRNSRMISNTQSQQGREPLQDILKDGYIRGIYETIHSNWPAVSSNPLGILAAQLNAGLISLPSSRADQPFLLFTQGANPFGGGVGGGSYVIQNVAHMKAYMRCKLGPVRINDGLRFCVYLDASQLSSYPQLKSYGTDIDKPLFVEIYLILWDYTSNAKIPSATYDSISDTNKGALLTYSIYWQVNQSGTTLFKSSTHRVLESP